MILLFNLTKKDKTLFNIEFDNEISGLTARYADDNQTSSEEYISDEINIDNTPFLGDNYPNPFNRNTVIPYSIPANTEAVIKIYSSTGAILKTIRLEQNKTSIEINTIDWSNGIYFYSLTVEGVEIAWKKMALIK
ncbi:MAG: T9SS type A sorting domain-containing protein [Bacteroidia bacterium]|nr:T9SS type A sorting domain-containing protein [Bacteroidia bacterium]